MPQKPKMPFESLPTYPVDSEVTVVDLTKDGLPFIPILGDTHFDAAPTSLYHGKWVPRHQNDWRDRQGEFALTKIVNRGGKLEISPRKGSFAGMPAAQPEFVVVNEAAQ